MKQNLKHVIAKNKPTCRVTKQLGLSLNRADFDFEGLRFGSRSRNRLSYKCTTNWPVHRLFNDYVTIYEAVL